MIPPQAASPGRSLLHDVRAKLKFRNYWVTARTNGEAQETAEGKVETFCTFELTTGYHKLDLEIFAKFTVQSIL